MSTYSFTKNSRYNEMANLLVEVDKRISFGVPKNNGDRISTEKHFADESILVDWLGLFLSFTSLWHLIVHTEIA